MSALVPSHLDAWEEPWEVGIHLRAEVSPVFVKKKVVSVKLPYCHGIFYHIGSRLSKALCQLVLSCFWKPNILSAPL